jgi:hypothetical protein
VGVLTLCTQSSGAVFRGEVRAGEVERAGSSGYGQVLILNAPD